VGGSEARQYRTTNRTRMQLYSPLSTVNRSSLLNTDQELTFREGELWSDKIQCSQLIAASACDCHTILTQNLSPSTFVIDKLLKRTHFQI